MTQRFIINISCIDQPGIVAAVTTALAGIGANITDSSQFGDPDSGQFFMRIELSFAKEVTAQTLEQALADTKTNFAMELTVSDSGVKPKLILLVSKFDHAILHLLYQIRVGWLHAEVAAIISNHNDFRQQAERENIPFYHLPISKETKPQQEAKILKVINDNGADLVVLARYMQILSNELSEKLFGKVINIHHSFLPSFKGAKPYHQAHARGVKLIGATAHYVTADLDEGPIIEQETERVTHAMSATDFVAVGREVESRVLARAVKLHLERRVMLNQARTIVFH